MQSCNELSLHLPQSSISAGQGSVQHRWKQHQPSRPLVQLYKTVGKKLIFFLCRYHIMQQQQQLVPGDREHRNTKTYKFITARRNASYRAEVLVNVGSQRICWDTLLLEQTSEGRGFSVCKAQIKYCMHALETGSDDTDTKFNNLNIIMSWVQVYKCTQMQECLYWSFCYYKVVSSLCCCLECASVALPFPPSSPSSPSSSCSAPGVSSSSGRLGRVGCLWYSPLPPPR